MPVSIITQEEVPTASSADIIAALPHLSKCRALMISTIEKRAKKAGETFSEHIRKALSNGAATQMPKTPFKIPAWSKIEADDDMPVGPIFDAIRADKDWNFQTMGEYESFARDFCDNKQNDMAHLTVGELTRKQLRSMKSIVQKRARYYADKRNA
jgi:hypothetical protein